jgi:hypothetical protein
MDKKREDKLINFRLNQEMFNLLCKIAEERKVTISELCRISVQHTIDCGIFIMETDEEAFVNKMYIHNVKRQPANPKQVGDIRRAFKDLWKDGLRCIINVDISNI